MQRFRQFLFVVSLLALSWFMMMAVHELGHVVGAFMTQGTVDRVVLHPLMISRTDVSPNPHPLIVVWLGPIVGCIIPIAGWNLVPRRATTVRKIAMFFAGYCLVANGGYISLGSFDHVGDCGVMLQSGSPMWTLFAFGVLTISAGFYIWHRLGSFKRFLSDPSLVDSGTVRVLLFALVLVIMSEMMFSSFQG